MTRAVLVVGLALALLVPAAASAQQHTPYVLRHPKREHCRAHYVRHTVLTHRTRRRQTVCIYAAPTQAPAIVVPVDSPAPGATASAGVPAASVPPPAAPTSPTLPAPTTTSLAVQESGCTSGEPPYIKATRTVCEWVIGASTSTAAGVVPASITLTFAGTGVESEITGGREHTLSLDLPLVGASCTVTTTTLAAAPHAAVVNSSWLVGSPGCPGAFYNERAPVAVATWRVVAASAASAAWTASESATLSL
jgi:hypothetical protein